MIESKEWVSAQAQARYAGYDRIVGIITWLFCALVFLDKALHPTGRSSVLLLGVCCLALICCRVVVVRCQLKGQLKVTVDLVLLLFFVVVICWLTGKTASPFVSMIYLILMIASLTLERRITYLMAALSVASYSLLAWSLSIVWGAEMAGRVIELFPFMLIAYLGTLLSRESENAHAEVERLSLTDDLTELNNMRSFETLALQQEKLSKRYDKPFAICMLDSDNLKQVNDRYGHLAGTELIKWTAHIIRQNTRASDIPARFGGDEFIIMYSDHDKEQILPAVQRIVRAMAANPLSFNGDLIECTLSAGVASFPADGADLRSVIMRADQAMYLSKNQGKNQVMLYRD